MVPMLLPTVAIVGRPNVGKSSLFNRLVGKPISIVDPTAGVTRDRVIHPVRREELVCDLIDTGGIGIVDEAKLAADVEVQIQRAIDTANHIVFVVDGRSGLHPLDQEIAAALRPHHERVLLVANKLDHESHDDDRHEFMALGLGDPWVTSATQARGIEELCYELRRLLPDIEEHAASQVEDENEDRLKLALVGRRNVGKSSLTNALLGEKRVIVADHAGTTRDAIDVKLDHRKHGEFTLIDTAGLRKKRQLNEDLEFYAALRTERAIARADVAILVLDAADELGMVDKKIAHFCETEGKPTVLVINKWDLAQEGGAQRDQYEEWLRDRLPGLRYAPIVYTCALTGSHVDGILAIAHELKREAEEQVPTSELNRLLEAAVQRRRPRRVGSSYTKLYYMTQIKTSPPTFSIFVNRTDWIEAGYSRYLENYLRQRTMIQRVPMRILFRARQSQYHDNVDEKEVTQARSKADRRSNLILPGKVKRDRRNTGGRPGKRSRKHGR